MIILNLFFGCFLFFSIFRFVQVLLNSLQDIAGGFVGLLFAWTRFSLRRLAVLHTVASHETLEFIILSRGFFYFRFLLGSRDYCGIVLSRTALHLNLRAVSFSVSLDFCMVGVTFVALVALVTGR